MFRLSYGCQFFYHFADKKKQVAYPVPLDNEWKEKVIEAAKNVLCIPATRARPRASSTTSTDSTVGANDHEEIPDTDQIESPSKRQRQDELQQHDRPTGRSKLVERSKKVLLRCLIDKGVTL